MSGRESLKGFRFQTDVMLLCFLEHCAQGADFYMVGEPATNIDTGDFVDIKLFIKSNNGESKKIIQVKKGITSNKAKEVVKKLLIHHLASDDQVELWFARYNLQNTMDLLDAYDNLMEAIDIPEFAQSEIKGNLGTKEITVRIDSTIPDFSFAGTTLKLHSVEVLDDVGHKVQIEDKIVQECGEIKKYVLSKIKNYLSETLIYRRHKLLDELDIEFAVREEILKKDYDFFKKIVIRQVGESELLLKIKDLIPSQFTTNQKELLQDVLFSFFYHKSSESQKIEKSDVEALICSVATELKYPSCIIDWRSKSSIHRALMPSLVPTVPSGDFSMGGGS